MITTGSIANLNPSARTFRLGASTVNFDAATLDGLKVSDLADGLFVRLRGQLSDGAVTAGKIQRWQAPMVEGIRLSLAGVISDYNSLSGAFKISDMAFNASAAALSGANANGLGNGVRVDVKGTFVNGDLQATQLKIRHVPGEGRLPSFSAQGRISPFVSPSNFKVRGQRIDASQPGVVFMNGTAASLGASVQVFITGTRVVDDVLVATQVRF